MTQVWLVPSQQLFCPELDRNCFFTVYVTIDGENNICSYLAVPIARWQESKQYFGSCWYPSYFFKLLNEGLQRMVVLSLFSMLRVEKKRNSDYGFKQRLLTHLQEASLSGKNSAFEIWKRKKGLADSNIMFLLKPSWNKSIT